MRDCALAAHTNESNLDEETYDWPYQGLGPADAWQRRVPQDSKIGCAVPNFPPSRAIVCFSFPLESSLFTDHHSLLVQTPVTRYISLKLIQYTPVNHNAFIRSSFPSSLGIRRCRRVGHVSLFAWI